MTDHKDVIVFDAEYAFAAGMLKRYGTELSTFLDAYCAAVRTITEEGIRDSMINERLLSIAEKAAALRPQITELTEEAVSCCKKFVTEIDEADQFLY